MLDARRIAAAVHDAVLRAASELRPDVRAALARAEEVERSPRARSVLRQLLDNADIAVADGVPVCQDTGMVWVLIELGAEECFGEPLQPHVDEAVAAAFASGGLRMSVARDALFSRDNTGDNTPAQLDVVLRPGCGATVHVMLKGGGSDNASSLVMLPPGAGLEGVHEVVLDAVRAKATSACPPLLVGVGVGGGFDKVATLSKRALLRRIGDAGPGSDVPYIEDRMRFETSLLAAINATGIGPAGLGGDTTALAVHIQTAPCHIASLPVAVNMGCCAIRAVSVDVA
ncbi:MAG: fumarate hydratase [Coriobacteriia bacterium]|jgi:fumarate hydratase class I/fumarate hydratase subunit alpha|nr:fumarate hydratase [Coriobacteriia bacterium]